MSSSSSKSCTRLAISVAGPWCVYAATNLGTIVGLRLDTTQMPHQPSFVAIAKPEEGM